MEPLFAGAPSGTVSNAAPRQVLIEAAILEVTLNHSAQSGLNLPDSKRSGHHSSDIGALANAAPVVSTPFVSSTIANTSNGPSQAFGYATGLRDDLDSTLARLSHERRVKILQRPRIQTSDAVPATLFVGEQRSYPGFYCGGSGYGSIRELQTGVTLEVTPLIKPDRIVQMDLRLRIDQFDGNVTIQNVGEVPVASSREAQAQVAVRDRKTLLLGGLSGAKKKKPISYVRFPKDLPVASSLSSTSGKDERSEFMVLVRPTLLPQ